MHPWELQLLQLTTALRVWLLESLADEDLAFTLPGNPSLGEQLVDLGRTARAYTDSFSTRRLVLAPSAPAAGEPAGAAGSVVALQAWFAAMDTELEAAVTAIPDDEFRTAPGGSRRGLLDADLRPVPDVPRGDPHRHGQDRRLAAGDGPPSQRAVGGLAGLSPGGCAAVAITGRT